MDRDTAKRVSDILLNFRNEMRDVHSAVKESSTTEEFSKFNHALTRVFHRLHGEILVPIQEKHPDIKTDAW